MRPSGGAERGVHTPCHSAVAPADTQRTDDRRHASYPAMRCLPRARQPAFISILLSRWPERHRGERIGSA